MKKIILFLLLTTSVGLLNAQTITPPDDYILDQMRPTKIPGVVVSLVKDGKVAFAKGYGLADIDKDIPYTPNTIQGVGSISKLVTATAIMKLWEQNEFELDDNINNYLPFPITNPFYPNIPITFRMLLSHTSSISFAHHIVNGSILEYAIYPVGNAPELGPFLEDHYVPGGSNYIDSIAFNNFPPGSQFLYSTFGYGILGYLVENISGMPFYQYCNQYIFDPLCMNNTAWYYSELNNNLAATPYEGVNSYNHAETVDLYEWADYPSQGLKSNAADISRFMQMHMNYGVLDGVRIIEAETEQMMRTVQVLGFENANVKNEQCLGFLKVTEYNNNNTVLFGHLGHGPGVVTQSFFAPVNNTVITVISNCSQSENHIQIVLDIHLKIHLETSGTISTTGKPDLNCSYLINPCQQNEAYWKAHQPEWPINSVPMRIGTKHYYSKNQLLALLITEPNDDAAVVLGKALVATKFNIGQGSELSQIISTINDAMNIIGDKRLPYNNPVPFSSPTGIQMLALAATLNSYNAGNMNSISCTGSPSIAFANVINDMESPIKSYPLAVFPNPSSSNISISFTLPVAGMVSLTIYDMAGRLIKTVAYSMMSEGIHQIKLDTKTMNNGMYILRLNSGEWSQTKKFVVHH